MTDELIRWFQDISIDDVAVVGGKNASLGEMISNLTDLGVLVPDGFATTASAYRDFLTGSGLAVRIEERLTDLDVNDIAALTAAGGEVRGWIEASPLPGSLTTAITSAYSTLSGGGEVAVAVRSSATAEDLPDSSFAGQQETYLNVSGVDEVIRSVRLVFASLYNNRAISYRVHRGYGAADISISAGIQHMVRSDLGASGVVFTIDPESGHDAAVFITSSYGLGELLVQGAVNPDEYYVRKENLRTGRPAVISRTIGSKDRKMIFGADGQGVATVVVSEEERGRYSLSNAEAEELGRHALTIEDHYGRPMDIEWGRDGTDGRIYILQARPETVQSRTTARKLVRYRLIERGDVLTVGRSVGQRIGSGAVRVITDPSQMHLVEQGDVLVADMTDPDWEPVMKRSAAIITNRGGRTCHAAIIARELEIPAVVGTGDATRVLHDGAPVTVSCAEGDEGFVYAGLLAFERREILLDAMPEPPTKIMMNVATPSRAFAFSRLPNYGVGLARMEFIINNTIGVHPLALLHLEMLDVDVRRRIESRIRGSEGPRAFFVEKLTEGIATIATAFYPKPVIVRMSDFKSNEYAHLLGGSAFEPTEENPMIGFRGAARYRSEAFADAFAMECEALRAVRDSFGLTNVEIMIPFVRTVAEAREVVALLESNGLRRGENGLRLIMMCEIPSNAVLASDFLEHFDGFSIGSNDLTQLTLALDRDSELVAQLFDERNPAVKALIQMAVQACHAEGKYVGICGQGPSDHPDFARWLVEIGLDSLSLTPDTVIETWLDLAGATPDG